jgi:hypothetical protein
MTRFAAFLSYLDTHEALTKVRSRLRKTKTTVEGVDYYQPKSLCRYRALEIVIKPSSPTLRRWSLTSMLTR